MNNKARLIHEDGSEQFVEPENGTDFKLEECYKHLNCSMIELLTLDTGEYMIVDEEGKLKPDSKVNNVATDIFGYDTIVGKALICEPSMFK